jgi:hypothetical protein
MDVSWRGPDAVTKGDARIWKRKEIETLGEFLSG